MSARAQESGWKPAAGPLMSRFAKDVSAATVHREYPRPQMVREQWSNLNGLWEFAIRPREGGRPESFDGKILVPFAVESALSGVMKTVGESKRLWYRRGFRAPELDGDRRLLLHFGAVDWHSTVWVNGREVGQHRGGYDPFSFDITDALRDAGEQELVVSVWDPTNRGYQPRGKQVEKPRGIWYTSVTGIWGTVWLEPVSATHVRSLHIVPDIDRGAVSVSARIGSVSDGVISVDVAVLDGDRLVTSGSIRVQSGPAGEFSPTVVLPVSGAKLWSPSSPFLYDLRVSVSRNGKPVDAVRSYFGMRKIAMARDVDGFNRLFLNNEPLFQFGPLDQGWWPDGLYTAPTDEALRYDIEVTRKLGFNMCRKHVKVEPERWYYHCDRLGLLVWQDMPNGDGHIGRRDPDLQRSPESEENFWREYRRLIDSRRNHPCIVVWVPFNEGWGQFKTHEVLRWTREYDPTRLVDTPSGWTDRGTGDINDIHSYPGPALPPPEAKRVAVLGEFGGLGLPLENHLWWNKRNWGYRTYKTREELRENYDGLMEKLLPMIGRGLAGAIYTQTTDVEGEVNGLMTYDRKVIKHNPERVAAIHAKFYEPQPIIETRIVVPNSREKPQTWRYTTSKPGAGWERPEFDDSTWKSGPGGFGEASTPGSVVRTDWKTNDIWLRRSFNLESTDVENLYLSIHHDEDAKVFINGRHVASLEGYTSDYTEVKLNDEFRSALKKGPNVLAVYCHQTGGGQYIDVGLIDVIEKPRPKRARRAVGR